MTNIYTVEITSQAEEQMQEITHYIAFELKAPDAALHLLDELEDFFFSLRVSTAYTINRWGTLAHQRNSPFTYKEFSCIFLDRWKKYESQSNRCNLCEMWSNTAIITNGYRIIFSFPTFIEAIIYIYP